MDNRERLLQNAMSSFGDTVYRLALCRTQCVYDAEDVYQDTFLRFLEQPDAASWDKEKTKSWLIRVALNRCHDLSRFRLRRPMLSLDEIEGLAGTADDEARELWDAVASLPTEQRVTVHLFYAEGYRTEEIAEIVGCQPATVRTRLNRARMKLRNILGGIDYERSLS